jgi:hypothetical protein
VEFIWGDGAIANGSPPLDGKFFVEMPKLLEESCFDFTV